MSRAFPGSAAALALAAALLGACRGGELPARPSDAPAVAETRTVVDAIGRPVTVRVRPARIVSLAPAITETLFAVGAGPQVVGVTRYCNHPREAAQRTIVGGFADPDVERVVALAPDLVIATADTVTREKFDALVAVGLAVWVTDAKDLDAVAAQIEAIGDVTGHAAEAAEVARTYRARIAEVRARVADRPRRRTMFLFSVDPLIGAGAKTFVDELIGAAGGENVCGTAPTGYPRYGIEGIVALKPEVIVTSVRGGGDSLRALLAGVPRMPRIVEVDADLVERPGPRLADGLARIAAAIHEDAAP